MTVWVLPEIVLAIHDRQIAEHGGAPGMRDMGLVLGALARLENLAAHGAPAVHELAAAHAWGLVRDHGFINGNKRTAYVTARLFLELNGHSLTAAASERVLVFTDAGAGRITEQEFMQWFARNTRPKP